MTPDDFASESQAQNARRQQEWEARARPENSPIPVGAVIEHRIERKTERLPDGSERTVVTLHPPVYYAGPDAANPPPEDAA